MNIFTIVLIGCLLVAQTKSSSLHRQHQTMDSDYNTNDSGWDLIQRENFAPHQQQEIPNSWPTQAASMPEAEPFLRRIADRVNESAQLASKDHIKEKLKELAFRKLYNCKSHTGNGFDRACVGRETGHMMQLIAAVEDVKRKYNFPQ